MPEIPHIRKNLAALFIILLFAGTAHAGLAENALKISLVKYDPYPVSPGSDFSVWVEVENAGDNDVSGASVEFIPKYPFSIKSGESAVKYPGTIRKNDKAGYRFDVHVDKNALVGTNTIELGHRLDGTLTKKEFNIEVGSDVVDSKGTVKLEKYTVSPEVLMAGDATTVTLTLKNSASAYTIKMDGTDYSMNAQIQSAELIGNDVIDVTSEPYYNAGIVGPGDSVELSYTVRVKNNTPDGTYFLGFDLGGSARLYGLNLKIPVRVDSSSIEASLSETPELNPGNIILNVANKRPNTVMAATVIPYGNATFEPAEYFISTMEPDELFTVKFDPKVNNNSGNIRFRVRFKNGDNWHESDALAVVMGGGKTANTENAGKDTLLPVIATIAAALIVIAGFFLIMRRRRTKSG
ncbi:MAG: COG1361 S-layer family protein [Candidatus Methanoperedens sp.]|nr:COG1361 S-layer family protein [Candidatus Methanoperedens sp.]